MTIKDIAELCGVSVSTVSRVLNNHPDVSAANRERVMAVVQSSHYVPNNSARDLVKPQSDTIGLVVRGAGNPFFTGIIPVIEQAIHQALMVRTGQLDISFISRYPVHWQKAAAQAPVSEINALLSAVFDTRRRKAGQVNWQSNIDHLMMKLLEEHIKWQQSLA